MTARQRRDLLRTELGDLVELVASYGRRPSSVENPFLDRLMEQLEEMARASGASRVTLMVSDFNQGAQAFYRSRGYWLLGSLPDAVKPGIGELVMVKDLQ